MDLSEDQQRAFRQIMHWFLEGHSMRLTFGGFAGTGKSTLIRELIEHLGRARVAVCAPTGKAAFVLREKGVPASTVHRLIYAPEMMCSLCDLRVDDDGFCPSCASDNHAKLKFRRVPIIELDLIIVDEASMLNTNMVEDLESFGVKVLYVGDHGQLEPIGDDPGLMANPDVRLEQIHRQAADSPIIKFAHSLRVGDPPAAWTESGAVQVRVGLGSADLASYDAILCGYNRTRVALNARVRKLRGFSGAPEVGERLICLQNDKDVGLFNGMLVTVTRTWGESGNTHVLDFIDDVGDEYIKISVLKSQFGKERKPDHRIRGVGVFDWGYAMTVHKSQGSSWGRVAVLEQLAPIWTPTRWRYTAATRASAQLDYFLSEGR